MNFPFLLPWCVVAQTIFPQTVIASSFTSDSCGLDADGAVCSDSLLQSKSLNQQIESELPVELGVALAEVEDATLANISVVANTSGRCDPNDVFDLRPIDRRNPVKDLLRRFGQL